MMYTDRRVSAATRLASCFAAHRSLTKICFAFAVGVSLLAGLSGTAQATISIIAGPNPTLPPQVISGPGGYLSPSDVHMIIDGLPPGSTIRLGAEHFDFFNIARSPGGSLGGEAEQFNSNLQLHLTGTGVLAGYDSVKQIHNVQTETHVAPRNPSDPVQSFDTDMWGLQGQIIGDPDFDLLRITAGTSFGMPSPGHTTLAQLPGGNYNVDSFFDITYRIDFVGNPGGPFAGRSGSTTGTIRMQLGQPVPEPSSIALAALGLVGLGWIGYRRKQVASA